MCCATSLANDPDIGIIDLYTYLPRFSVSHRDLEQYDGVSGKYTTGLGQHQMSFVTDREDVASLALTAVDQLIRNAGVHYSDIGRLDVGTETVLDRSKSLKSRLMQLFVESGNFEVEGLDCTNGCYGGTAALLNACAWLESSAWDGRLAVVVCGDVAVYAPGPARATGGAGAVAMLVGRGKDVQLAIEHKLRATHMEHTYDFFKPDGASEYPTVDGAATVECYTRALEKTYQLWKSRAKATLGLDVCLRGNAFDYVLFHTPFNKMVRKAVARMVWHDMSNGDDDVNDEFYEPVKHLRGNLAMHEYKNREATKLLVNLTSDLYQLKAEPGAWLARETGNMYTASLYAALCGLVVREGQKMNGKRILLYSFGSGMAATMLSLKATENFHGRIGNDEALLRQLNTRKVVPPQVYSEWMDIAQANWNRFGYTPTCDCADIAPFAYYLDKVHSDGRRIYRKQATHRTVTSTKITNGAVPDSCELEATRPP